MDELLRDLERKYAAGNPEAGAAYYSALMRRDNLIDQLEKECLSRYSCSTQSYDTIPRVQTVYIGWDPTTRHITTGVIIIYYFTDLLPPPKARMDRFMDEGERWNYRRAWDDYLSQERGDMHVFVCSSALEDNGQNWTSDCHLLATRSPTNMKNVKKILFSSHTLSTRDHSVLASLLDAEEDFEGDLEDLEEHPEIIDEICEDYPCCGHDICPPRWSDGGQASMVCTCGTLLPVNSRFSICNDCLGVGYDDFGYREYDGPDDEGDYDEDDEEDDYDDQDSGESYGQTMYGW